MKNKILSILAILTFLAFSAVLYEMYFSQDNVQKNPSNQQVKYKGPFIGQAKKDIGPLPSCTGAVTQAKAMLELMAEEQGKNEYQIYYKTEADEVTFTINMNEEKIIRLHKWSNEYSTLEQWQGYVMERLSSAAAGESLNTTPVGPVPGTFQEDWHE